MYFIQLLMEINTFFSDLHLRVTNSRMLLYFRHCVWFYSVIKVSIAPPFYSLFNPLSVEKCGKSQQNILKSHSNHIMTSSSPHSASNGWQKNYDFLYLYLAALAALYLPPRGWIQTGIVAKEENPLLKKMIHGSRLSNSWVNNVPQASSEVCRPALGSTGNKSPSISRMETGSQVSQSKHGAWAACRSDWNLTRSLLGSLSGCWGKDANSHHDLIGLRARDASAALSNCNKRSGARPHAVSECITFVVNIICAPDSMISPSGGGGGSLKLCAFNICLVGCNNRAFKATEADLWNRLPAAMLPDTIKSFEKAPYFNQWNSNYRWMVGLYYV